MPGAAGGGDGGALRAGTPPITHPSRRPAGRPADAFGRAPTDAREFVLRRLILRMGMESSARPATPPGSSGPCGGRRRTAIVAARDHGRDGCPFRPLLRTGCPDARGFVLRPPSLRKGDSVSHPARDSSRTHLALPAAVLARHLPRVASRTTPATKVHLILTQR